MKRNIIFLFLLASLLRIIFCLYFHNTFPNHYSDDCWDLIGWHLITKKGYTTDGITPSTREPIYPLFLALIYLLSQNLNPKVVSFVQSFVNSFCVILIFYISFLLTNNKRISNLAGLIWCLYPSAIINTAGISSEVLFVFWLLVVIFFWILALKRKNQKYYIFLGISLGLCTLTRLESLFLFFLIVLSIFSKQENLSNKLISSLIVSSLGFTFLVPWLIRNYIVFDSLVLSTTLGINIYMGAEHTGDHGDNPDEYIKYITSKYPQIKAYNILVNQGIEKIRRNPLKYLSLMPKKLYALYRAPHETSSLNRLDTPNFREQIKESISTHPKKISFLFEMLKEPLFYLKSFMYLFHFSIFFLGILGIKFMKKEDLFFILSPILTITIIHLFLLSLPRFNYPIMPYFVILSSITLDKIFKRFKRNVLG